MLLAARPWNAGCNDCKDCRNCYRFINGTANGNAEKSGVDSSIARRAQLRWERTYTG